MFVRKKGNKFYLVENRRENGKVRQRIIKYLGVNPNGQNEYLPKLNVIYNSTVQEFLKKMPDDSCDCIIADPPYFISPTRTITTTVNNVFKDLKIDWDQGDPISFYDSWLIDCFRVLKPNLFLFTSFQTLSFIIEKYSKYYKDTLIWHKTNAFPRIQMINQDKFISACEVIIFFQKKKGLFNFLNPGEMHNFIETPIPQGKNRFHPTQKHDQVISWLIQIGSRENSLVLDLFSGSGTTSRVARSLNRHFIGVEDDISIIRKARQMIKKAVLS